jgi:hypothetical protein
MTPDELTVLTSIDQKLGQIVSKLGADEALTEVDLENEESVANSASTLLLEKDV